MMRNRQRTSSGRAFCVRTEGSLSVQSNTPTDKSSPSFFKVFVSSCIILRGVVPGQVGHEGQGDSARFTLVVLGSGRVLLVQKINQGLPPKNT